jgi:nitrilase
MGSIPAPTTVKVAVTNHEPCWLQLSAGVAKTISLIKEASSQGCKFIAFPETWLTGYPAWIWSRPVDLQLGVKYVQNSLIVSSAEMQSICLAAAECDIAVSLGFSERSGESVYIAQALIDRTGKVGVARRKMKPTHMERTVFGDASGDCLSEVVEVEGVGKVGQLSCWEHIQPLLKFWTFSQGEQIHVAAWPVLDMFVEGSPGFWSMTTEG